MTQKEFNFQWDPEAPPACDEGMVLLKAWADNTPGAIDFAHEVPVHQLWITPSSSKADWEAFTLHVTHCPFCKACARKKMLAALPLAA